MTLQAGSQGCHLQTFSSRAMRVCSPWQGIPTFLSNRLIVSFLIIYLLAICFLSQYSSRDPTSLFFRPYLAYQPSYSSLRDRQARSFIEQAADEPFKRRPDAPTPQVCLAIRTVARHGVEYFSATVGSLLDTLNATERDEIFFIPLLAHSNPRFHPAFWEKWLDNLADVVLTYDLPADGVDIKKMRGWERDNDFNSKTLWDLTYLLKRCVDTGAEYVLVVEDDVVAARGWYEKMKDAVREVESKMWEKGLSDCEFALPSHFLKKPPKCKSANRRNSLLPPPLLHRKIPRLEHRILADLPPHLPLPLSPPQCIPPHAPPLPTPYNTHAPLRPQHPHHPLHLPPPHHHSLLRRWTRLHATSTKRRAGNEQSCLLFAIDDLPHGEGAQGH